MSAPHALILRIVVPFAVGCRKPSGPWLPNGSAKGVCNTPLRVTPDRIGADGLSTPGGTHSSLTALTVIKICEVPQ